jgi:mono/diheme cytochrome c family protein
MNRTRWFGAALAATVACAAESAAAADQATIARGEYLARAGDCTACHTAEGGQPFAGGQALQSPFGPIYAPNITPDRATGIGDWSDDDFYRAMHEGVGKHGQHLYPAFPYPWFTKVTRDDVLAIKAYLFSLPPVNARSHETRLPFPFNIRAGIAGWNAAFVNFGEFRPDPAKSDQINRGAYLAEGLGHCGDCHTPKGPAMEPDTSKAYSGGAFDVWYAPNITSDKKRGVGAWSDADLAAYLKTGLVRGKGVAVGPMSQTIHDSLAYLTDQDINAIVAYLKDTRPIADYTPRRSADLSGPHATGQSVYLTHCAYCHQVDGKGLEGKVPALSGDGAVQAKGPQDVVGVILGGRLAEGTYALMPPVGADMTDEEVAEAATYVRNAWSNAAPGVVGAGLVGQIRARTTAMLSNSDNGAGNKDLCRADDTQPAVKALDDPQNQIDQTFTSMKQHPESILPAIDKLIARARQLDPSEKQADIVNSLTQAYCRFEIKDGAGALDDKRRRLTRFSQLVYSELTSNGNE